MPRIPKVLAKFLLASLMITILIPSSAVFAQLGSAKAKNIRNNYGTVLQQNKIGRTNRVSNKDSNASTEAKNYVEGQVLVSFKKDRQPSLQSFGNENDLKLAKQNNFEGETLALFTTTERQTTAELIRELSLNPEVDSVQPNYKYQPMLIETQFPVFPNDPDFNKLWSFNTPDIVIPEIELPIEADIDMPQAWDLTTGSSDVIVAIIDDGVDFNHPDLQKNLWDGSDHCFNSRGDYIREGCPNHGWDFSYWTYSDDPRPDVWQSHGTHIAGTIAATANNNKGVVGINHDVSIMALKTDFTTIALVEAIYFARNNNAKIINASWGGYGPWLGQDKYLYNAIKDFGNYGGLFVTAAGNGALDHDNELHAYPCDWDLENIICVAATDQNNELTDFSDYGKKSVDIAAPGIDILSTISYGDLSVDDFNNTELPSVPSQFTEDEPIGYWGSRIDENDNITMVGDIEIPYRTNTNAVVEQVNVYDYSKYSEGLVIKWDSTCDTEYDNEDFSYTDYMQAEWWNGEEWDPLVSWDELDLDDDSDPEGSASGQIATFVYPEEISQNNKIRFRWISNDNEDTGSKGLGCSIDNLTIVVDDSENTIHSYEYYSGTSMATPHVAGVVALMLAKRDFMGYFELKNYLMNTGDYLLALEGKIKSALRLNAYRAVGSIAQPRIENLSVSNSLGEELFDNDWTDDPEIQVTYEPALHEGKVIGYDVFFGTDFYPYLSDPDQIPNNLKTLNTFNKNRAQIRSQDESSENSSKNNECEDWEVDGVYYYLCHDIYPEYNIDQYYGFVDTETLNFSNLIDSNYRLQVNIVTDAMWWWGQITDFRVNIDTRPPTTPIITKFEPYEDDPHALILEIEASQDKGIGNISYFSCVDHSDSSDYCGGGLETANIQKQEISRTTTANGTQTITFIVRGLEADAIYYAHIQATDGLSHQSEWAVEKTQTLPETE